MMTSTQLVEKLKARVEVVEEIGGSIGANPKLIEDELTKSVKEIGVDAANYKTIHTTEAKKQAQERYLAVILLSVRDRNQNRGRLLQLLKNGSLKDQYAFPVTLSEALEIIND